MSACPSAPPPPSPQPLSPYSQLGHSDAGYMGVPLLGKAQPPATVDYPVYPQHAAPPPPYSPEAAFVPQISPPPPPLPAYPQQQVIVMQPALAYEPGTVLCSACQQFVTTNVRFENGGLTWLLCAGMCLVGLNLGCCFIPFCVDACKDAVHQCPRCGQELHRQKRL